MAPHAALLLCSCILACQLLCRAAQLPLRDGRENNGASTPLHIAMAEKAALLAIKDAMAHHKRFAAWTNHSATLSYAETRPCEQRWPHITCNQEGRVTGIFLNTPSLATLSPLEDTSCYPAALKGSIPWRQMAALQRLQVVDVAANALTGEPFDSSISQLTALTRIVVARNHFTGSLPSELMDLPNLQKLDVSFNTISGAVPASISRLAGLTFLDLHGNQLDGRLPAELAAIKGLEHLDLSSNSFQGDLPSEWAHLQQLTFLSLSHLSLQAAHVPDAWSAMSALEQLDVGSARLKSTFPAAVLQMPQLSTFTASDNDMFGPIPIELLQLQSLNTIDLSSNYFSGPLPPSPLHTPSTFSFIITGNCLTIPQAPRRAVPGTLPRQQMAQRPISNCTAFYTALPTPTGSAPHLYLPPPACTGWSSHSLAIALSAAIALMLLAVIVLFVAVVLRRRKITPLPSQTDGISSKASPEREMLKVASAPAKSNKINPMFE